MRAGDGIMASGLRGAGAARCPSLAADGGGSDDCRRMSSVCLFVVWPLRSSKSMKCVCVCGSKSRMQASPGAGEMQRPCSFLAMISLQALHGVSERSLGLITKRRGFGVCSSRTASLVACQPDNLPSTCAPSPMPGRSSSLSAPPLTPLHTSWL